MASLNKDTASTLHKTIFYIELLFYFGLSYVLHIRRTNGGLLYLTQAIASFLSRKNFIVIVNIIVRHIQIYYYSGASQIGLKNNARELFKKFAQKFKVKCPVLETNLSSPRGKLGLVAFKYYHYCWCFIKIIHS